MAVIKIEIQVDDGWQPDKDLVIRMNLNELTATVVGRNEAGEDSSAFLFPYMQKLIEMHQSHGRVRTAETYKCALNSIKRFLNNRDILLKDINKDLALAYEAKLRSDGIAPNTSSFYLRKLRAVYNHAVDDGLTKDKKPFKQVFTGMSKTNKRAVDLHSIRLLRDYEPADKKELIAQGLFMFSFYTRGMAFVDMTYLKRNSIEDGYLRYWRRKCGQPLAVRWEQEMQEIVDRLSPFCHSDYLLPIVRNGKTSERSQYRSTQLMVNKTLKNISENLHIEGKMTMYVARHSWASIARGMGIPLNVISQAMGHTSEKTTQIYLKLLDKNAIDKANAIIMKELEKGE